MRGQNRMPTIPKAAGRLSGLPAGVVVERDRIEVRYAGAKEAVVKLVAQAQALNHDYERFESLVAGEGSAATPWPSAPA